MGGFRDCKNVMHAIERPARWLVRNNADVLLYPLTFGWMLGLLAYGSGAAEITTPVAVAFHYGFPVWFAVPLALAVLCCSMMRMRQRVTPTWRYWYRRGIVGALFLTCLYALGVVALFAQGVGVMTYVEVRYVPPTMGVEVRYGIDSRQWNMNGEGDGRSVVRLIGSTDLSHGVKADFTPLDADGRRMDEGACVIVINGREAVRGGDFCYVGDAGYTPWGGLRWHAM